MADEAIDLDRETDPHHREWLLQLRARTATNIADGRRSELVFEDLISAASERIDRACAAIVTVDRDDVPRVRASQAPNAFNHLIHGVERRRWFGAWSAAIARQTEIIVPEIAASSLYREHRTTFVEHGILATRAAPIMGRHHVVGGALVLLLEDSRILSDDEIDVFEEISSLAGLALRREQERSEMLDRLRYDRLTGLETRDGLEDHLRTVLNSASPDGPGVGLLFVDIDDLTLVNDSLGHTAGDTIIATTANRIKGQLMRTDHVVRFGGDEFIVVLDRIESLDDARSVAERIRKAIRKPVAIGDTTLTTTVSIGISIGHADTSPLQLIDQGHAAVVRAKQDGRGSTADHDVTLDAGAGDRLDREQRLQQAMEDGELTIFWQPKVDLRNGRISGAEALVRWNHPEQGIIGPDGFIPTAERAALIDDLSTWVLQQAISEAVILTEHIPRFSAAINLSSTQLVRADIDYVIAAALEKFGLPAESLIIELTESTLANQEVIDRLYSLRDNNVRLAIDDFGTGYSSLSYVRSLPVGIVKIDRAFLGGLKSDGSGAPVLAAAVAMARALGKSTTVEGVETAAQLRSTSTRCRLGPGLLLRRTKPARGASRSDRGGPDLLALFGWDEEFVPALFQCVLHCGQRVLQGFPIDDKVVTDIGIDGHHQVDPGRDRTVVEVGVDRNDAGTRICHRWLPEKRFECLIDIERQATPRHRHRNVLRLIATHRRRRRDLDPHLASVRTMFEVQEVVAT